MIAQSLSFIAMLSYMAGCTPHAGSLHADQQTTPPLQLLGEFKDDYGIRYTISDQEWHQQPNSHYRVVRWNTNAQYLIAQNEMTNSSNPGKWTRIDWIVLSDMPPYKWAFCLSAYSAPTAEAAEQTNIAKRDSPRTGCNGYPFSRMQAESTTNN